MIETRSSACQDHPKNSVVYVLPRQTSQTDWSIRNPTKQTAHDSELGKGRYNRNKLKFSEFDILQ